MTVVRRLRLLAAAYLAVSVALMGLITHLAFAAHPSPVEAPLAKMLGFGLFGLVVWGVRIRDVAARQQQPHPED